MFGFALKHMTLAKASFAELQTALQCVGIDARNDLSGPLFDGLSAKPAGQAARGANLTILALAGVCVFDNYSVQKQAETESLMVVAEIAPRICDSDKSEVHMLCRSRHASTRCTGSILIRAGGVSLTAHHLPKRKNA